MEDLANSPFDPQQSSGIKPLFFILSLIAVLIVGGVIGYGLGLYQAAQQPPEIVVVTATPDPQAAAKAEASPANIEGDASATAPTPTIMEFLLADARHFQGNADAPVTIIEFSDFK